MSSSNSRLSRMTATNKLKTICQRILVSDSKFILRWPEAYQSGKQVIQNEIKGNNWREDAGNLHSLVHYIDPSFLSQNLEHRHESLGTAEFQRSDIFSKHKTADAYIRECLKAGKLLDITKQLHTDAGGNHQQAHGKYYEATQLPAGSKNLQQNSFIPCILGQEPSRPSLGFCNYLKGSTISN